MAKVAYRMHRSRKRFFDSRTGPKVQAALEKVIDATVKPHFIKQFNAVVSNWRHKPKFNAMKRVERDSIEMWIEAFGPNAKYWVWVDKGTKPHTIWAKRAPNLRFRRNHSPKTKPGRPPTHGGPGRSSGAWVSKKMVRHPGTKPRDFSGNIFKKNKKWFSRTMNNAWRRIIRSLR